MTEENTDDLVHIESNKKNIKEENVEGFVNIELIPRKVKGYGILETEIDSILTNSMFQSLCAALLGISGSWYFSSYSPSALLLLVFFFISFILSTILLLKKKKDILKNKEKR